MDPIKLFGHAKEDRDGSPSILTTDEARKRAERLAELEKLEPISFEELERVVRKWLLVADVGIIKLIPALIVANMINRDPVWMVLIGPSGGGKTAFLNALFDLPMIVPISNLTTNTFMSGMQNRGETSLLPQINGKILVFKDWTTILSLNFDARNEIMAQLREIYDGRVKKVYGNGKVVDWSGKVGLLAGSTAAVDLAQQMHTTLGERFLQYRITMPERQEVAKRVLFNNSQKEEMRKELSNAYFAFMKSIEVPADLPIVPEEVRHEIISLADFSTKARSGVIRDSSFKKEVIYVPGAEMPTRPVEQLDSIGTSYMVVNNGKFIEEDMNTVYKIALDSIPQTNKMVMMVMAAGDEQDTAEIAAALGYPTGPIRMYLENLALLGVCKRIKAADSMEGGTADKWTLHPEYVAILRKYEKIKLVEERIKEEQEKMLDELDQPLDGGTAGEEAGGVAGNLFGD